MADDEITKKDIYREQYAHVRSMNDILYKVAPLFSVAIGGLWYFAASQMRVDKAIATGVFAFAALLAVCCVNVMERFGTAFNAYLDNLNKLDGDYRVTIKPSRRPSTVKTILFLLIVAAVISIIGAGYVFFASPAARPAPTPRQTQSAP
ncbi:hypothetical protein [Mesorhizobium sp.]|uniref:hypothetical protein n=1 Tax=Mesorhizobium sp. TaxID=1871066 RepID=UPI000FEA383E|nr:hypothetical protein [Mesorhizobium sp.]RWI16690.1 MAG: hypothetical protein EOQ94_29085 [Mesorhizobium sp.]RWN08820.1 MAG: hypothetical protein EOR87_21410 [Mesorhizobium sp.]RWN16245.1 MAG: hypothetical protein EOR88_17345 [Mesorhizobium sp.]